MIQIRKAKRSATRLRLLLTGPSGSGKTYSALRIAKGLGGKTCVIDTERGSSDLYDGLHDFDVIDLEPPYTPERYIEALTAAEKAGYEIIIVDSISHEWTGSGGCLELVDQIAVSKFRGNTWSAYSEITPRHRAFLDTVLYSKAHIIATGRSKTETAQTNDNGKTRVVKLGMKTETREGAEYEFTIVLDLTHENHYAIASKDRTGLFTGDPQLLTEAIGKQLAAWLEGAHARPEPQQPPQPTRPAPQPARTTAQPPKAPPPAANAAKPEIVDGKYPSGVTPAQVKALGDSARAVGLNANALADAHGDPRLMRSSYDKILSVVNEEIAKKEGGQEG